MLLGGLQHSICSVIAAYAIRCAPFLFGLLLDANCFWHIGFESPLTLSPMTNEPARSSSAAKILSVRLLQAVAIEMLHEIFSEFFSSFIFCDYLHTSVLIAMAIFQLSNAESPVLLLLLLLLPLLSVAKTDT